MSRVVSIHSYRGGTGKSNISASLAAILARRGQRVGVVDTDIQSPGIHVLFGMDEERIQHALNDYLWGRCAIEEAAYEVGGGRFGADLFLIPSSLKTGDIARVLREGYDVGMLNDGFRDIVRILELDVLLIDTHPGLNEETLLSLAITDVLFIVLRPDQQDYLGTAVTVEVARRLDVPGLNIIVNKVPSALDPAEVGRQVSETYGCAVAGVVPHSDEMMQLGSAGIFALEFPDHPITATLEAVAEVVMSDGEADALS